MIKRSILDRFHIWWWENRQNPDDYLPQIFGWPVPIETNISEAWDAGGA